MLRTPIRIAAWLFAATLAGPALAVQACELNGQPVNPNNGYTTEGKTGLMRCRDGEGGPLQREQELQNGKFMGLVRYYRDGMLEKESRVNEKGNRDGVAREWAKGDSGKAVLVREETLRDGRTVGSVRTWYPNGPLRRVAFHGDDEREQASVEFNAQGQLYDLRCGSKPLLGPDFDDKAACGFGGAPATVTLYAGKGTAKARLVFERGDRRRSEQLYESGAVREFSELTAGGGVERNFAADGTKRRELQWVSIPAEPRPRRATVLDQEFHESGKLVRERRWKPAERGADLLSESTWYLNGQPKVRTDYTFADGRTTRREAGFHDNGKPSFVGEWRTEASSRNELAVGTHQSFDSDGRLRSERIYDARGRISRERELDERGAVVRDDEVFEDGSRKAVGR